jgi:hypothetical protein
MDQAVCSRVVALSKFCPVRKECMLTGDTQNQKMGLAKEDTNGNLRVEPSVTL